MKMLSPLPSLLILTSLSLAIDPPAKMWESMYYPEWDEVEFRDIELVGSDSLFVSGVVWAGVPADLPNYVAILLDSQGDVLWAVEHPWYYAKGLDCDILPDGSYILTGRSEVNPSSSSSLFLLKISPIGSVEWARIYDHPSTTENGWQVTVLPDDGFAVAGRVNGTSTILGEAWILRTDANGDTLWTDIWGTYSANWGHGVEYDPVNDWIVVAAFGKSEELPTNGPHLLYYTLDGQYLFGTDYPSLGAEVVRGFLSSADGGYAILSRYGTGAGLGTLTHTNALGEIQWSESVTLSVSGRDNDNLGLGFAQIDGGFICCGWDGWNPPDSLYVDMAASMHGNLSRFDSGGNALWQLSNEVGHENQFYTAVQLQEGGYMAAGTHGGDGYLVRYAPETGIGEDEDSPAVYLGLSPNPVTSSLSVAYSLPEATHVSLMVYDLSGRAVGELESRVIPEGEYTSTWDPGELPSGCYVVVLRNGEEIYSRNCVLVR